MILPLQMMAPAQVSAHHPDLLWALPFWLQTGLQEQITGSTLAYHGTQPAQVSDGISFLGTTLSAIDLPAPLPVSGPITVVSRYYTGGTLGVRAPIISDVRVDEWGKKGFSFVLRFDGGNSLVRVGAYETAFNKTYSTNTWYDVAASWNGVGYAPKAYINGVEQSYGAHPAVSSASQASYVGRLGAYYDEYQDRMAYGIMAYWYLFTASLSLSEIQAIHANPESVL